MKTIYTLILIVTCTTLAFSQSNKKTKSTLKPAEPIEAVEKTKQQHNAPDKSDFESDEAYLKAKDKWVNDNKAAYNSILKKADAYRKDEAERDE